MSDPALLLLVGMPQWTRLPLLHLLGSLDSVGMVRNGVAEAESRLLADLELRWPASGHSSALPPGWREHPATSAARLDLQTRLAAALAAPTQVLVIDHLCDGRLVPFWRDLAQELGVALHLQICLSDPATIASSQAQQLWWRHNLEAIHAARSAALPLSLIDATSVGDRPVAWLERWLQALPGVSPGAVQRQGLLALLNQTLNRDGEASELPATHPKLKQLHQRLLRQPLPHRLPASDLPSRLAEALALGTERPSSADPRAWSDWLDRYRSCSAPRAHAVPPLAADPVLHVCGPAWQELEPHQWLQRAPLQDLGGRRIDPERCGPHRISLCPDPAAKGPLERIALNLELPPLERAQHWLEHLRAQQLILDPEPARVLLLRTLGLPAWWLDPLAPTNGWLQQPLASMASAWAQQLGMAPPEPGALVVLGAAGREFEQALTQESRTGTVLSPRIQYWPGWPELVVSDAVAGLARAGWLSAAFQEAAQVLQAGDLPASVTPADLRALQAGRSLRVLAEDRPSPPTQELFAWGHGTSPTAAVVVSLFNYADRINEALDSVAAQTAEGLELIVVDDASSDAGAERVKGWMERCVAHADHPFVRLLLLSHTGNAGLAAARNTAFAAAQSPWCFVLDADNALYPRAVEACLQLAGTGDGQLAVVHPLLAVEVEAGRPDDQRSLVSTASWQRSRLLGGNVVDAMALVRRTAWQAVGGYTHIQGGWEDFDFWCKLLDACFYGLQCPEVLAVYRSHADSMSHTATNRSWRALSRTLQDRHPWLDLPLATP